MRNVAMADKIRKGLALIEAAYKIEVRIATQDGVSSRKQHGLADEKYFQGNRMISQVLEELDGHLIWEKPDGRGKVHRDQV